MIKPALLEPAVAVGKKEAPTGRNGSGGRRPPLLQSGDRLTRLEFERRYRAYPEKVKAELVEGVVYMPSPVRVEHHGQPTAAVVGRLLQYAAATPGVNLADNATLRLDMDNEVQPDVSVWLDPALGGRAYVDEDGYLAGVPELLVEVAASSVAYDMHDKRRAYRRNGVQEYLVLLAHEQETVWFSLVEGEYQQLTADADGIIRSQLFPGLYFQSERFWRGDLAGLLQLLQQGLQSTEHADFKKRLAEK